jgi:hypothetical protein
VANAGTFTASYPDGTNAGAFTAFGHRLYSEGLQAAYAQDNGKMSVAFGASNITVTNSSGETLPANTNIILQLNQTGQNDRNQALATFDDRRRMVPAPTTLVLLGAPITADTAGLCASQAVVVATTPLAVLNGTQSNLYSGTRVQLDVPRNVVAAWTGTAVITITGKDEYGVITVERSASGTALIGKKAFKQIDSVSFSANVTAATVGFGDVLGLPFYLSVTAQQVLQERQDATVLTTGTFLAGVQTAATATTGDVRGTYDPVAVCDGTKAFSLLIVNADAKYRGADQYAG